MRYLSAAGTGLFFGVLMYFELEKYHIRKHPEEHHLPQQKA